MNYTLEKEILFDDFAAIENKLGNGYLATNSINANCDCSSYSDKKQYDERASSNKSTGANS